MRRIPSSPCTTGPATALAWSAAISGLAIRTTALFAAPSYAFIVSFLFLIVYGLVHFYMHPTLAVVANDADLTLAQAKARKVEPRLIVVKHPIGGLNADELRERIEAAARGLSEATAK